MSNQIHLNVERYRVPEVLFEPTSVGIDQAGIVETIGYILRNYSSSVASEMCKVSVSLVSSSQHNQTHQN